MKGRVLDVTRALCMIIHKINEKLDPNHPKDPFDHSNVPRGLEVLLQIYFYIFIQLSAVPCNVAMF